MRGKVTVRNPAEAVAMAKCWLSRWADQMTTLPAESFHPDSCAYCEEPADLLIQTLEDFKDWSGICSETFNSDIEQWLTLPAEEHERLVRKAQAGKPVEVPDTRAWWTD